MIFSLDGEGTNLIVELGNDIYQIDVCGNGIAEYTSAYLVKSSKTVLIETGATPGLKQLFSAFEQLDIGLGDIDYVVVTHVHLDHSGGVGVLLRSLPGAKVLVHPRGARHLIEPSRLCRAVKALYGEVFNKYFAEVAPIDENRVYSPAHGEKLDLGGGRRLTFYYTTGHARHHMVIYDSLSKGLFSGDALGIWYHLGGEYFVFPVTPPPEFDLDGALATCKMIRQLSPENIYFTHFGKSSAAVEIISRYEELVRQEVDLSLQLRSGGGALADVENILWELMLSEMSRHGIKELDSPDRKRVSESLSLSAKGIFAYLSNKVE